MHHIHKCSTDPVVLDQHVKSSQNHDQQTTMQAMLTLCAINPQEAKQWCTKAGIDPAHQYYEAGTHCHILLILSLCCCCCVCGAMRIESFGFSLSAPLCRLVQCPLPPRRALTPPPMILCYCCTRCCYFDIALRHVVGFSKIMYTRGKLLVSHMSAQF